VQTFRDFIGPRAGCWTLAYQVKESLPDRHGNPIV
jgi:hypothetical protein